MPRVLFLAYHFPPVGGGGVQRNAKFARYLPELGFEPCVVTGSGEARGRWTPYDPSLLADVEGVEIRRIQMPEPSADQAWRRRAERWLEIPSPFTRWWLREAEALGVSAGTSCDVVYASLAPYETAEAAARIARRLGKPWVADLQDPWALDEMWFYPTALHRRRDLRRMGRLLASAAAVIMNSPEAALRLRRAFPALDPTRVTVIPNGFDRLDFGGPSPVRADGVFRIVHAGYLHTETGYQHRAARVRRALRGRRPDVDVLPRSHVYLLEAIRRVLEHHAGLGASVELHLAGPLTAADRLAAAACDFVRTPGYLPHASAVELVRSADLLFLPLHDVGRGRAGIVPGKTYEYLASGRPILAAVPEGDARDLLAPLERVSLCEPADVDAMAETLLAHVLAHADHGRRPDESGSELDAFDRRALTEQLAAVLGSAAEGGGTSGELTTRVSAVAAA